MTTPEYEVSAPDGLRRALRDAVDQLGAPDGFTPHLERPGDPSHGDLTTNAAFVLAGPLRRPPREIAMELADMLPTGQSGIAAVEVAGPGFLNIRLDDDVLWEGLAGVVPAGSDWGRSAAASSERVNVEFVSANPTGPLHVAHGRGAAIGDAVASLLEWTGHSVEREYYVNDAGRQIELLGRSVDARMRQARGETVEVPEGGYQGEYLSAVASRIAAESGENSRPGTESPAGNAAEPAESLGDSGRIADLAARAAAILRDEQADDLDRFGVRFDNWFAESRLFEGGEVPELLARLELSGSAYRDDEALWLRTSDFGDEKDRVLVKRDGSHTYFVSDIAYHIDKRTRQFDRSIDVWGADHHGHVLRMRAALEAAGVDPEFLEVIIIQLVTVMRGGEEVKMSKRAGTFVTLRELLDETGPDVARYFFLMRRAEVPMAFDLDLALDTSEKNPVYKVQYAHARMCRIFERADLDPDRHAVPMREFAALELPSEREVAKAVLRFPEVVASAARARAPYQVCQYLEQLAGAVNGWYHEGNLDPEKRVLAEGPAREARLGLANAVRVTLRQGLRLLGLSAPERMIRELEEEGA
ncbi:MAG: arginine--tRNA ligase [marine benthic group bacterium]|nr:arginine--tRNA ligase [Gemmatimonadota bacterium]